MLFRMSFLSRIMIRRSGVKRTDRSSMVCGIHTHPFSATPNAPCTTVLSEEKLPDGISAPFSRRTGVPPTSSTIDMKCPSLSVYSIGLRESNDGISTPALLFFLNTENIFCLLVIFTSRIIVFPHLVESFLRKFWHLTTFTPEF